MMTKLFKLPSQLLITAVFMSACSYESFSFQGPFKAVVVAFTGTDNAGTAQYAMTERTFRTLTDFNSLDGNFATIKRGGTLKIRNINGSLVSAESFEGGEKPSLRYRVKSGVATPLDYSTLAMLSAYYQLDEIYSTVEDKLGLAPTALQGKLPGGKHTVLFEPEIKLSTGDNDISAGIKLNAAFSPADKKFLLFQRSPIEKVPLAANFQVLSHEFGHFVFDFTFYGGALDTSDRWAKEWAMSGINEGFADFVSWAFTDSTDILRSSIDISEIADERDFGKAKFTFRNKDDLNYRNVCSGDFYCVGTIFAKSLYEVWGSLKTSVSKKDMVKGVVETISKCKAELDAMDATILPPFQEHDHLDLVYDGKVIGSFLRAFIRSAPPEWKTQLCAKFDENFGDDGFHREAREGLCN